MYDRRYSVDVPPETLDTLDRYAKHGIPTGGFLEAVLSNDLMGAVGRADGENLPALKAICQYVYMELPSACHGSPSAVEEWLSRREKEEQS